MHAVGGEPAGPRRRLISGNLRELAADRLGSLTAYAREYGDFVPLRLGPWPYVLVSHPEAIKQVLVTENSNFVKGREYRLNKLALGNGLVVSDGAFWLRQRRLMQPAFRRESIARYAELMVSAAERAADRWRDGETRDVQEEMIRLTLHAAVGTLLSADVEGKEADIGVGLEAVLLRFRERFDAVLTPPDAIPTRANLRLRRAVSRMDNVVYGLIAARRAGAGGEPHDLLSLLLAARDEDGHPMTDKQVRDETMTLLLAGHETTANALSWTWYLLARHPRAEQELAAELAAVLRGRNPSAADLANLRYTAMVVHEALRLYPPSWGLTRRAIRDCEIAGHRVRRGVHVCICQSIVHRDPRWFHEPDQFRPERWADGLEERLPPYAYFPFGGGQRLCIGTSFAMMELVLVTALIAQRFRLELDRGEDVAPVASLTLRPRGGLQMTLRRRA